MQNIFGKRLKEIRQSWDYNQRDFAKLLNVTQGALCRWETGENLPNVEILYQIAKILDVSSDYLIGLEN